MKERVDLGAIPFFITLLFIAVYLGAMWMAYSAGNMTAVWIIGAVLMVQCLLGLCFSPMSISVNEGEVCICASFYIKSIPLGQVESVELFRESRHEAMGKRAYCFSGGFMGFWGPSRRKGLGEYYSAYGKLEDRFLLSMKDGRKYLLGCRNAAQMVVYIEERIR